MRLQLDTNNKTIKLDEDVVIGEFIETLKTMLPDGLWKEYKLETSTTINWINQPTIINPISPTIPYIPNPYPTYPWITYCDGSHSNDNNYRVNSGIYNVEIN